MDYIITSDGELYHYGVKGMKWGHRKKPELSSIATNVKNTKAAYKDAKKAYGKSFNKAYAKSHQAYSLSKTKRAANDKRWEDVYDKATAADKARNEYKTAKKARKDAVKSTYKDLKKKAGFVEKHLYSEGTRKKAAKYIVDNNMSVAEATKKAKGDAWRNTAAFVAGYGAIAAATIYANR